MYMVHSQGEAAKFNREVGLSLTTEVSLLSETNHYSLLMFSIGSLSENSTKRVYLFSGLVGLEEFPTHWGTGGKCRRKSNNSGFLSFDTLATLWGHGSYDHIL